MKNGFKALDADLHIVEPIDLWNKRLPDRWRSITTVNAPGGPEEHSNYEFRLGELHFGPALVEGLPVPARQARRRWATDQTARNMLEFNRNPTPELLIEGLDAEGLDVAAIVPTLTFVMTTVDKLHPEHALAICRVFNDWIAEFVAADRNRMRFWGWLPRQDAELAAQEARRCVEELGADGVGITSGAVDGRLLTDPHFEPLYREVNRLDVPFGIHVWGASPLMGDDIRRRYWGQPQAVAANMTMGGVFHGMSSLAELTLGGALERYPNLRPVIMEAGNGWMLFMLERMDEKWELYEPEFEDDLGFSLPRKPSEYVRDRVFVTCEGEEHALKYLEDYGLADNLVFSTDYPHHDAPWPHAVDHLLQQQISDETKRKILWDTPERMFRWKQPPQIAHQPLGLKFGRVG